MIKSIPGSSYYVKRSEVSARQVRAALQTRDTAMKTAAVASKQFSEPKWDPELKHLLETAACRSYESTDEVMRAFQEH
ncbi:MAG: hypothetical protein FJZ64_04630, partial [Chlamydiae bacterium]|nr:hypothetical protein [Chlamydiota bacterium]